MAGGTFDKAVGKVRPGTYINFRSTKEEGIEKSSRGVVLLPVFGAKYGPVKEAVEVTASNAGNLKYILGYSVYDDDDSMFLIKEALKNASTVIAYFAASSGGAKAQGTGGGLTCTAKYAGSRGNVLSYSVVANPTGGFDVSLYLDGSTVATYEGVKTADEVVAQNCKYVDFAAVEGSTGDLEAIAGVTLSGGEDVTAINGDYTDFLDAAESIAFNTMAFPVVYSEDTASLFSAAVTKVKYMRENVGKAVQIVVSDYPGQDYEGVINLINAVVVDGKSLTHAQATAWLAGATAGASYIESNTYKAYDNATAIVDPLSHEEAVAADKSGNAFFTISEAGAVVLEYDINSLVTYEDGKDKSYRKNRVIRVLDTLSDSIKENFAPNKYSNSSTGWDVMEGIGKSILKEFENAGAITDVDYDSDFAVDRDNSEGDETYFDVAIKPVDSSEKLYFTVSTQ